MFQPSIESLVFREDVAMEGMSFPSLPLSRYFHSTPVDPIPGPLQLVKRVQDIMLAMIALLIFALPMILVAIAIRLDSPGPVLFRQRRTGLNNCEFAIFKFRTMRSAPVEEGVIQQATRTDSRITRVGAFLRRTSLDELPQLFNVILGDMSLVGPRPHAPGTCAAGRPFEQVVARYDARHRVKPGLTGLAQVRGFRGETDTEEKLIHRVASDLEYIDNWSLWQDAVILARTALTVLCMKNAY